MYDEILLTTDGSEGAERAVEHAAEIGESFDAKVHVLYVVDVRKESPHEIDEVLSGKFEDIGKKSTEDIEKTLEGRDLDSEAHVEKGVPHKAIIDFADKNDIDVIVMSSHGRTGIDRLLIGSVTEKVVRKFEKPVLTVGRNG